MTTKKTAPRLADCSNCGETNVEAALAAASIRMGVEPLCLDCNAAREARVDRYFRQLDADEAAEPPSYTKDEP